MESNTQMKMKAALIVALAASALFAGCSKGSGSANAQSSPAAMVYSGSTDTSTGGAAATAAPAVAMAGDAAHGKEIFTQNCAQCHGASGIEGGVGPSLKGEKTRKDPAATIAWIHNPSPPMPKLWPSPLNDKDVADVTAYVQSL